MEEPVDKHVIHFVFPLMIQNPKSLRKVVSNISSNDIEKIDMGFETLTKIDEVFQAECGCCGLKEDCTEDYIAGVKNSHAGIWVCGLCSEAVKENLAKNPEKAMEEAVDNHREICQNFHSTRLNPKLTFTYTMKNIAKRSYENRKFKNYCRSSSCVARINVNIKS